MLVGERCSVSNGHTDHAVEAAEALQDLLRQHVGHEAYARVQVAVSSRLSEKRMKRRMKEKQLAVKNPAAHAQKRAEKGRQRRKRKRKEYEGLRIPIKVRKTALEQDVSDEW